MATIAYLRVSTGAQDLDQQRLAIFDYAQKQRLTVDEFVETKRSSQHAAQRRELMERVEALAAGRPAHRQRVVTPGPESRSDPARH